jgi:hypothetical protein
MYLADDNKMQTLYLKDAFLERKKAGGKNAARMLSHPNTSLS